MSNILVQGSVHSPCHTARTNASHRHGRLATLWTMLSATILSWIARSAQRQGLRELGELNDDHLLEDIGLTRDEALRLSAKPFWRQ